MNLELCKKMIKEKLLSKTGKIIPIATRKSYQKSKNLEELIQFIEDSPGNIFPEKVYKILYTFDGCRNCGLPTAFVNFHKGYSQFCSHFCAGKITRNSTKLSEESSKIRSEKISQSRKNIVFTAEWREKMSKAAKDPRVQEKKKKTNKERYGIENPGVLGAFSSDAAKQFILSYLTKNNIDQARCSFKYDQNKEFFQNINIDGKNTFVSYDLVIFKTIEAKQNNQFDLIEEVLEYNGPWHYRDDLSEEHWNDPATPYPKSKTKKETINTDRHKIERIKQLSPSAKIKIFWEKDQILETVSGLNKP